MESTDETDDSESFDDDSEDEEEEDDASESESVSEPESESEPERRLRFDLDFAGFLVGFPVLSSLISTKVSELFDSSSSESTLF